jgi:WD40 repeat protein
MTMVSASEDCTVKIWDLATLADPSHTSSLQDLEPYLTLRGHTGPIMSIGASNQELENQAQTEVSSLLYSGGINGSIHLWGVPGSHQVKPYGPVNDS